MERQINVSTADVVDVSFDLAGLGARTYAFVIDWHIRVLIVACWALVGSWLVSGTFVQIGDLFADGKIPSTLVIVYFAGMTAIYLLYHPVVETITGGRTPGKRIAGIRVVTAEGHTPGVGAPLVRNLFRIIDSLPTFYVIGIVFSLINKRSLRVGDLAAGTVMVYDERTSIKKLEILQALGNSSKIDSPAHQAILVDVLERWSGLHPEKRLEFATWLFDKAGVQVPELPGKSRAFRLRVMRQRLLMIVNGDESGLPEKSPVSDSGTHSEDLTEAATAVSR